MVQTLIDKLKELVPIETKARKAKAKIILEFMDAGGYLAYGFDSFKSFYDEYKNQLHYSRSYYHQLIQGINAELILGIPIGTYTAVELKGIKGDIISPPSYNSHDKILISGHSIIINENGRNPVDEFRQKWKDIQDYTGKEYPTPKEIEKALKHLFDKIYAKRKDVASYYTRKIQLLEETIQELNEKCDRLTLENKDLKQRLNKQSRELSTPTLLSR